MPLPFVGVGRRGMQERALSVLVPLHVQRQVVGTGEAAPAGQALERLGPGVLAVVAGELI